MEQNFENRKGYVSPLFLCRIGGMPVNKIDMLRPKKLSGILRRFSNSYRLLLQIREKITVDLYKQVSIQDVKENRRKFLELRRSVYNLRELAENNITGLSEILPGRIVNEILEYNFLMKEYLKTGQELNSYYRKELERSRKKFRGMVSESDFQKGLLLASSSLFSSQTKYLKSKKKGNSRKKDQVENGLLRYYSRMAMKTSPFSTFGSVLQGEIKKTENSEGAQCLTMFGELNGKKSRVYLNKEIPNALIEHIKTIESVRNQLILTINPTLTFQNNELEFIVSADGREENKILYLNKFIQIITDFFDVKSEIKYRDLLNILLGRKDLRITEIETKAYLDKLIQDGLLQINTGVQLKERKCIDSLINLLENFDDHQARLIVTLLKDLQYLQGVYVKANVNERADILENISAMVDSTFSELGISFENENIAPIYEEVFSDSKVIIDENKLSGLLDDLTNYVKMTSKIAWPLMEQLKLRKFWADYYGGEKKSIPLLQFYKDYYRRHCKGQQSVAGSRNEVLYAFHEGSNPDLEMNDNLLESSMRIQDLIRDKWKQNRDAEEIDISFDDLAVILKNIPEGPLECSSVTLFSQLAIPPFKNLQPRIFLKNGNYVSGYGKFISRCSADNTFPGLNFDGESIELSGDLISGIAMEYENYSRNISDPLKWEIAYPGCESFDIKNRIMPSDIFVELDAEDDTLKLRHKGTGKFLYPTDLGFSNPKNRPPLYSFLTKFSTKSSFGITLPEKCEKTAGKLKSGQNKAISKPQITYCPRITINKNIIISRKKWFIPSELFPSIKPSESETEYFVRLNKWRIENNLPEEIYIKNWKFSNLPDYQEGYLNNWNSFKSEINNDPLGLSKYPLPEIQKVTIPADNKLNERKERNTGKPQYIDFRNPLFVNLFKKMELSVKSNHLIIEERFPDSSQLPEHEFKKFAAELVLQFDFPKYEKLSEKVKESNLLDLVNA